MNLDIDNGAVTTPDEFWQQLIDCHQFSDDDLDHLESAPISDVAEQHFWQLHNATIPNLPREKPDQTPRSQMTDAQWKLANITDRIGEARSNNQPTSVILNLLRLRRRYYRIRLAELIAAGNNSGAARIRFLLAIPLEQELDAPFTRASRRRSKTAA